jgi:hypothetical protein
MLKMRQGCPVSSPIKYLGVIFLASLISGCKLVELVPPGGDVISKSGAYNCGRSEYCEFDITASNFREEFTAIPQPGYEFVQWQAGTSFECGESSSPTCTVALPENTVAANIFAAFFGTIVPEFQYVGLDRDGASPVSK